jgi:polysaccharide biosynthesis transport protein
MRGEEKNQEIDLKDYWRVIVKRRWLALTFAGALIFLTAVFSFLAKPQYKSTVTLLIEEQTSRMLSIEESFGYQPRVVEDLRFFNTQLQLLKSKSLAERVATKLNLLTNPEFVGNRSSKKKLAENEKIKSQPPSDPYSGVADEILQSLGVTPIRETKLVRVSFIHHSPILATEVINTLAEEFINFSIEKRSANTQQASDFLRAQITSLREEMAARERELQKYGQEKELVFLSDTESAAVKKFADLNDALTGAQRERIRAETEYRALKDFEGDTLLQFVADPNIQQLKAEHSRIKTEYEEKSKVFKPDYPEMVRLKARLDSLKEQIGKAVDAAEARYRTALSQESSYKNLLERQKTDVANTKNDAILYESLKIEVEAIRKRYNNLLERQKEMDVSAKLGGISASNITIIDKAEIPKNPVSPKKRLNLLLAILIGTFGGVGLCFLFEYFDDTVKGPEDVEKLAGLPSLGMIPYLPLNQEKGVLQGLLSKHRYTLGKEGSPGEDISPKIKDIELINHFYPDISVAEDYRTIRTSILLSHEIPPKTILFTSAMTQEGKTASVANLAVSFGQLGESVLAVEADLRRPRLHRIFDVRNSKGLSGYLTGQYPLKEAIQKTSIENIWVLPSGPLPPNPAELLNSKRMKDMLEEVRQVFDIILLDSPPILAVVDPVITAALVDVTILVVQSGKIARNAFLKAVEELRRARAKIIGVLFNQTQVENAGYFSNYDRYYRSQYHEEEKTNS